MECLRSGGTNASRRTRSSACPAAPDTSTTSRSRRSSSTHELLGRNHDFDAPDARYVAYTHTIYEQDRRIVESQHPEALPLDLTEELHLKVPDAATIEYRRLLAELADEGDG
jgi:hypothetical protein